MRRIFAAGMLLAVLVAPQLLAAPPPGSPSSPIDDIEPRTPIHAADLPLVITAPGSYYLVEDITTTFVGDGITIEADDVTIDLMGFTLRRATSGSYGIKANGRKNLVVRNGTVAGWGLSGVYLELCTNSIVRDVVAEGNGEKGIYVGHASMVVDSIAQLNKGDGIHVGDHSLVRGCLSIDNDFGIVAGDDANVHDSTTFSSEVIGIQAGEGSTISRCDVVGNKIGIYVGTGSRVAGCAVHNNREVGIQAYRGGRWCWRTTARPAWKESWRPSVATASKETTSWIAG